MPRTRKPPTGPPAERHVGTRTVGPLTLTEWEYRGAPGIVYVRCGTRDLGSWSRGTGSARVGPDMRTSHDEATVIGWFLNLVGAV